MRSERFMHRLPSFGRKPSEEDRADSFELAVSARRFSRRTQAVLDDKLSFSATLMRAGEVEAANRLLAEVGEEVLSEEVALLERVNEVKAARSVKAERSEPMTRGRMARTLAVAMLGASLFAFSAAGAAVAGLFTEGDQAVHGSDPTDPKTVALNEDRVLGGTRQVKLLKNVSLSMTAAQFRKYSRLTDGRIDEKGLESFLLGLLPDDLAEKVHFALVTGMNALPKPITDEVALATEELTEHKDIAPSARERKQGSPSEDETPNPSKDEPTPSPSGSPEEDPSPSPEETPGDDSGLPLIDDGDDG